MFLTLCPSCGHQNKIKGFCTRCGLNLMLLPLRNAMNINSAQTAELNQGLALNLATQRLDAAQTRALTPRVTVAERATTRLHETIEVASQSARPYVSAMLAVTALVFLAAFVLWRSIHVSMPIVANAATVMVAPSSPAPVATATPASLWMVIETETQAVANANHALIADRQCAVIEPNGQLAITLTGEQFFGNGAGADVLIHGTSAEQTSYRIFVRDDENAAWQRIDVNRKGFAQGQARHDMGHHGVARARQVLIRNDSLYALQLDGIASAYPNLAATTHSHRH